MEDPKLEEQLAAIDNELSDAVLEGNERMIRTLQNQRSKIQNILLGNDILA